MTASSYLISLTTDALSATGNYGFIEPFAHQINLLRVSSQYLKNILFYSYDLSYPSRVFILNGDPQTVELSTNTGFVEIPKVEALHEAMFSGQTCWYQESDTVVIFGAGLTTTTAHITPSTISYLDYEGHDEDKIFWIQHTNNRWVMHHSSDKKADGLLPSTDVSRIRVFLRSEDFNLTVRVDGIVQTVEPFDLTDPTDEFTTTFKFPETPQTIVSTRVDDWREFVMGQGYTSTNAGISISLGLYTSATVQDGDSLASVDILKGKRFILDYSIPHDRNISRTSPDDLIGWDSRGAVTVTVTDGVVDRDVEFVKMLIDRHQTTFRGPDTRKITPTTTVVKTTTIADSFKWTRELVDRNPSGLGAFS